MFTWRHQSVWNLSCCAFRSSGSLLAVGSDDCHLTGGGAPRHRPPGHPQGGGLRPGGGRPVAEGAWCLVVVGGCFWYFKGSAWWLVVTVSGTQRQFPHIPVGEGMKGGGKRWERCRGRVTRQQKLMGQGSKGRTRSICVSGETCDGFGSASLMRVQDFIFFRIELRFFSRVYFWKC